MQLPAAIPEKPWDEQSWDYTTVARVGLQWFLPDTLPQTARNTKDAGGTVAIWLQPMAAPAANCCSSRDSPSLPSPQLACRQGKTPLLPKPPNSHMKAISWTSVRDWTPPCSRSVHRFPKPNYFPWLRQHATTWLVIFSLPKDVSQHSKPAGANSKILIPIQNYTAALFPLGIHYHCPNLWNAPKTNNKKISFQGGHSPAKHPSTS